MAPFVPFKFAQLMLSILLLGAITSASGGCAANKCDCPKFNGHRLSH